MAVCCFIFYFVFKVFNIYSSNDVHHDVLHGTPRDVDIHHGYCSHHGAHGDVHQNNGVIYGGSHVSHSHRDAPHDAHSLHGEPFLFHDQQHLNTW